MNTEPAISVIIPAYNAEATLAQTIDSVRHQTMTDFEVLIVNDGSVDATAQIAQDYVRADARMRLLNIPNGGVSAARNLGVRRARGRYIAFLDADDLWEPRRLDLHARHLDASPAVGVSFSRTGFLDHEGKRSGRLSCLCAGPMYAHDVFGENPTTTCSALVFRREVLAEAGMFVESMSFAEDQELLIRVLTRTDWRIEGIEEVLVWYRASGAGLSSKLHSMDQGWETMVNRVRTYAPEFVSGHYARGKAIYLRYLARRSVRLKSRPVQGLKFMIRSILYDWRILLDQPGRSWATMIAVCLRCLTSPFFLRKPH